MGGETADSTHAGHIRIDRQDLVGINHRVFSRNVEFLVKLIDALCNFIRASGNNLQFGNWCPNILNLPEFSYASIVRIKLLGHFRHLVNCSFIECPLECRLIQAILCLYIEILWFKIPKIL